MRTRLLVCGSVLALAVTGLFVPHRPGIRAAEDKAATTGKAANVDFNRHIRPILSDHCFACHGPDEKTRKAKLRLDTREGAFSKLRSGSLAIVPGKPQDSELLRRVVTHDQEELMPPPKTGKKLTEAQKQLLKQWIEQGATWSEHWAFTTLKRPPVPPLPKGEMGGWPRNPIDHFIRARLYEEGLEPSPEADRTTLIRRVTLDLTGLPPTIEEIDAFLKDTSPNAYGRVVDRLLASPRYGEHMARHWLDAARYGDTHGMHLDNYREMWPYRDWVINAFNKNMPFDQFLIEQLAGDLLPNATLEQQVATGFLRCHVTTSEGGSIEEEVYVRNTSDRVDTNGTVLLGLSVGCARCHDHRYDPISMKEYYQLFAFFNNIEGSALDGNSAQHAPVVRVPTAEQAKAFARVDEQVKQLQEKLRAAVANVKYDPKLDEKASEPKAADLVWIDDGLPAGAKTLVDNNLNRAWDFVTQPVHSGAKSVKLTAAALAQVVLTEANPPLQVGAGDRLFAYVYLDPANPPKEIMLQWHTSNWLHRAYWGENLIPFGRDTSTERRPMGALPETGKWVRLEVSAAAVGLKPGMTINGWAFTQHGGTAYWDRAGIVTKTPQSNSAFETYTAWLQYQRSVNGASLPKELQDLVKQDPKKHNEAQKKQLLQYFLETAYVGTKDLVAPLKQQLAPLLKEKETLEKQIPTTLIYRERKDVRPSFILKRGEYDKKADQVDRGTPAFLPPFPADAPKNRLGFAKWLVQPDHPLTARVAVNRFWQQCFGVGLVKTAEDFGSQGEPPTHRKLLDWLAVEFMSPSSAAGGEGVKKVPPSPPGGEGSGVRGWDVKHLMKLIVTSATYRQSAKITKDRLAKDPHNRFLSRGPRFRLDAEMLRDQALFLSGLLVEKVGGPSVKPPQPAGLWEAVAFTGSNTGKFTPDKGHEKVHRRSMYIFWKRTAAPPQMTAFDAPSREACTVRRERTNTPLQALLLMNEEQFVEAARGVAQRVMKEGGQTDEDRLKFLFRLITARLPEAKELAELQALLRDHRATFAKNEKGAQALIQVGETRPDAALNPRELAAWTMVANLVLNLDEVVTR